MGRLTWPLLWLGLVTTVAVVLAANKSSNSADLKNSQVESTELKPYLTQGSLPEISVQDKKLQQFSLSNILTAKTLLVVWNGNCDECTKEIEFLQGRTDLKFQIVFVNTAQAVDEVEKFLTERDLTLETYFDPRGQLIKELKPDFPANYYVVDRQIRYYFPGRVNEKILQALNDL